MEIVIITLLLVILAEITYMLLKARVKTQTKKGRMIFVDTSVLIDGRIITVVESGFITETLAIPRSVIGELQFLADNADHDKRSRARHGLDIVQELQKLPGVETIIFPDGAKAEEGVDERLLKLAKQHGGSLCTIDFNLNKVAQVEGIRVLNINQLAQTLRMAYLPGEKLAIQLVTIGQDSHQAVGYLADGTMVVVEHANKLVGQTVEVEFIRSLQTAAGKMMFAKLVQKQEATRQQVKPKPRSQVQSVPRPQQATPRPARPQGRSNAGQQRINKRPPRANEREAAFVDLVNKQ